MAVEGAAHVAGTMAGEGEMQGEAQYEAENVTNEVEPQMQPEMHEPTGETAEEKERRRKGKGICMDWAHGVMNEGDTGPGSVISGSGSCDPLRVGGGLPDQLVEQSSEDADSKAGPMSDLGTIKDRPILISEGSQQDEDLGGEGGRFVKVASEVGMEKKKEEGNKNSQPMMGTTEAQKMKGVRYVQRTSRECLRGVEE